MIGRVISIMMEVTCNTNWLQNNIGKDVLMAWLSYYRIIILIERTKFQDFGWCIERDEDCINIHKAHATGIGFKVTSLLSISSGLLIRTLAFKT